MNLNKIRPKHLSRRAIVYLRQSTLRQVVENTESTTRQYALAGRAESLGWSKGAYILAAPPSRLLSAG